MLKSDRASRWHAAVIRLNPGEFRIMDLDTKNGTRVNGERIFESHPLRDGDIVTIGGVTSRFITKTSAPEVDPEMQALRSTRFESVSEIAESEVFDAVGYGVMVLDDADPKATTETARNFLAHYFPSLPTPVTELPDNVLEWLDESRESLQDPEQTTALKPFRIERGGHRLTIRVKPDVSSSQTVLIFLDERPLFTCEQVKTEFRE